MNTKNLETLKIHKLTQAQYDRELAAGNIDENALYLTPDDNVISTNMMVVTGTVADEADPTFTADSYYNLTTDKTYEEVLEHVNNGGYVVFYLKEQQAWYALDQYRGNEVTRGTADCFIFKNIYVDYINPDNIIRNIVSEPAILMAIIYMRDGRSNYYNQAALLNYKSDWNVNDNVDPTYILNRTHYDSRVWSELCNFTDTSMSANVFGYYIFSYVDAPDIPENNGLKVVYDGTEYYLKQNVATFSSETLGILSELHLYSGNHQIMYQMLLDLKTHYDSVFAQAGVPNDCIITMDSTSDTGEPFCLMYDNTCVYTTDTQATEHSIAIYKLEEGEVKKLDEKYLPDSTFAQSDWNVNEEYDPAYIKNRTHYIDFDTVTHPESTVSRESSNTILDVYGFEQGKTYNVTFNGTVYPCEFKCIVDHYGYCINYLGNGSLLNSDHGVEFIDTTEPFCIDCDYYYNPFNNIYVKESGNHTIKIDGIVEEFTVNCVAGEYNGLYPTITAGQTYNVHWDGADYTLQAYTGTNDTRMVYLGNGNLLNPDEPVSQGNEPFLFAKSNYDGTMLLFCEEGTHTYGVQGVLATRERLCLSTFDLRISFDTNISLEYNKEYTVIFDNVEYKCKCTSNEYEIGNRYIMGYLFKDTGEPFYISSRDGLSYEIYIMPGSHTITIKEDVYNTIDKKFLPKLIGVPGEGKDSEIFNDYTNNKATGMYSHAEGTESTASGHYSHAEGSSTTASGWYSHAEGDGTTASGQESHAEGSESTASGNYSHAEGDRTVASGNSSHAEGGLTTASGQESHAEGWNTIASGTNQHVQGSYNIEDAENRYLHIVGNGSYNARSNAHTLAWDGTAEYQGDVIAYGCESGQTPISLKELDKTKTMIVTISEVYPETASEDPEIDPLIIHPNYVADKTFDEIYQHVTNGGYALVKNPLSSGYYGPGMTTYYNLEAIEESVILFSYTYMDTPRYPMNTYLITKPDITKFSAIITSDNEIIITSQFYDPTQTEEERLDTTAKTVVGAINEVNERALQLSNPNLFINGDFRVWQRGKTISNVDGAKYTADRWQWNNSVSGGIIVAKVDGIDGMYVECKSACYCELTYKIEDKSALLNKDLTLSFYSTKEGVGEQFGTVRLTSENDYIAITNAGVVVETGTNPNLLFMWGVNLTAGEKFNITNIKLEPGSIATPLVPRHYGEELALCKRYYQLHSEVMFAKSTSDTYFWGSNLSVEMRVDPTLEKYMLYTSSANDVTSSFGSCTVWNRMLYLIILKSPISDSVLRCSLWLDAEIY